MSTIGAQHAPQHKTGLHRQIRHNRYSLCTLFLLFEGTASCNSAGPIAGISRKAVRHFPQVDSNNGKTLVLCHLIDQFGDIFSRRVFHTTDREARFVPENIRRQDPDG